MPGSSTLTEATTAGRLANGRSGAGQEQKRTTAGFDFTGIPGWALVLVAGSLAAILLIGGLTLYAVSGLEADAQHSRQQLKVAKATQALVNVVAERQRHENLPVKIDAARAELQGKFAGMQDQMASLEGQMTDMQAQLTSTEKALVATQDTMTELLARADTASAQAAKASASLRSGLDAASAQAKEGRATLRSTIAEASTQAKEAASTLRSQIAAVQKTQKQLEALLSAQLKRLAAIENKISALPGPTP